MRKHALLVGVEEYRDKMISRLQFARADAMALAERLRERCAFDHVRLLTDESDEGGPDLVNIVTALRDMAGELREEDLFLFFFAGHGVEKDGHGYLLARDSIQAFPEHGSLSLELLRKTFERLSAGKRILLLDACRNSPDAGRADAPNCMGDVISRDIVAAARSRQTAGTTTALLSACRSGQRAYEWPAKGHGVFTQYLVEGLDGAAWSGGKLEFRSLAGYAARQVRHWAANTPGLPIPQEPWYEEFGDPEPLLLADRREAPPLVAEQMTPPKAVVILPEPALHVETVPSGAALSVDGRPAGAAPVELTLPAGEYRIQAVKEGYKPWERRIRLDAARDAQLRIELEERPRLIEAFFPMTSAEATEVQRAAAEALGLPLNTELNLGKVVRLKLAFIPAGTFLMGSPGNEDGSSDDEGPQHEVTLTRPLYMGIHQVTQEEYEAVTGKLPSHFFGGKTNPVECVSWDEGVAFCHKVSQNTGKAVRLPSEAEWEYACRAGTGTPFHFGVTISTYQANYSGEYVYASGRKGKYRKKTTPVGSFPPNAWGLYDMHGNVWEWCEDPWHDDYAGAPTDGSAWEGNDVACVLRGGSWCRPPRFCRSASRLMHGPVDRDRDFGFRIVVDLNL